MYDEVGNKTHFSLEVAVIVAVLVKEDVQTMTLLEINLNTAIIMS